METKHTFCRICESSCGLEVDIDNGQIENIRPNKSHIGTLGFSCMKGLYQHKMYDSGDRLTHPLKRQGDSFVEISWEQAFKEIGANVKRQRKVSKQSTAMYVGTAAGFSILHPIFAEGFMQGLESHNIYSSSTQDCANRFASAAEMYGFPFFQPFVDLDNVECMLVIGTNPVVSKWTFLQVAHPVKRLKELKARGAKTIFIDPRLTESAKVGTEHHFIRPNTDVFFFLSFLNEIFANHAIDTQHIQQHMTGLESLRELSQDWTPEKAFEVTNIPADEMRDIVNTFVTANGAAIVTGTGLGMGKNGTLSHWLAECINAITGNLDRKGGTLVGRGIFDFPEFARKNDLFMRSKRSRIGGFRELNGGFPGGILADEILTPGTDQIKSLFVTGGNPLLTMANGERLKKAFESLEMLVVTDIYMNETASMADYVLPATSPLQRPDLPFIFPLFLGMQSKPYLAATDAIVPIQGEQKDEATIYFELAKACGVSLFNNKGLQIALRAMEQGNRLTSMGKNTGIPQKFILDLMLRLSKNGSFKSVAAQPDGKPLGGAIPGDFLSTRPLFDDRKIRLAPSEFIAEAHHLNDIFNAEKATQASGQLRLISKRVHSTHNSWTQNVEELTNGRHNQTNYLYLHPLDAEAKGVQNGDPVDVESTAGKVRLPVKLSSDLMPGTAAMQHGWGHQQAKGLSVASKLSGVNVNILASDGPENIEKISGMVHLTGIPVSVNRATGDIDSGSWSGITETI
ncbi:Polysulfide reductase chain A [BD1-7 clade bacterium]|uniref:Polysulfide reductase chain A n=1 Tax=BD1-7 clade bacterium TaxID=2029982 RepID=A0A5S9QZK4_9GAMM|nr:Polysulfide reductase chain A [BD1-7 clade bacterium]